MRRSVWQSIVLAGIAGGVVSTLVQVILWLLFTDAFPAILLRDTRLAAAIVLGPSVLAPETFDIRVMAVATAVHFLVSVAFCVALPLLIGRRSMPHAVLIGAAFGAALYAFALHVMTLVFPWLIEARGAITLAAHVAFGASAAATYRCARRNADGS